MIKLGLKLDVVACIKRTLLGETKFSYPVSMSYISRLPRIKHLVLVNVGFYT
jgi:hypothetical protein